MYIRTDPDWVADQLARTGHAGTPGGRLVSELIQTLESNDIKQDQIDTVDDLVALALNLFKGHPVVLDSDEKWVDAVLGDVQKRDRVRVKPDAYLGTNGAKHNGKTGYITGIRTGKVTVIYDGGNAESAVLHEMNALQKLDVE